jgi:hypothetical protein
MERLVPAPDALRFARAAVKYPPVDVELVASLPCLRQLRQPRCRLATTAATGLPFNRTQGKLGKYDDAGFGHGSR